MTVPRCDGATHARRVVPVPARGGADPTSGVAAWKRRMCEMFGFGWNRRSVSCDVSTNVSFASPRRLAHPREGFAVEPRPGVSSQASAPAAEDWSAALIRHHLTRRHLTMAGLSLALLAVLCLSPSLLGDRVSEAVGGLDAADPGKPVGRGNRIRRHEPVRRSGLASGAPRRADRRLPVVDASARYAVGCGLNAVAPAHVGSAVRVALFGRVTNGGCWTVGGAAAAVGATRTVWLGVLIAIGSMGGVLPRWPLLVIAAIVGGSILLAYGSQTIHASAPARPGARGVQVARSLTA